jgi:hypothetical protein
MIVTELILINAFMLHVKWNGWSKLKMDSVNIT